MNTNVRNLLALFSVLLLAACGTSYAPKREAYQPAALEEARAVVRSSVNGTWLPIHNGVRLQQIDVLYSGLRIVPRTGVPQVCKFREMNIMLEVHHTRLGHTAILKGCKIKSKYSDTMYIGYDLKLEQGRKFVDAVQLLKQHYEVVSGPDNEQQQKTFDAAARQYRASSTPTVLPEAAEELSRNAEIAASENRVDDAIELYTAALDLAPAWPQGYYQRGVLNGEIAEYTAGVRDLNKYLKLEPDTQDAQSAKSLVYQWQGLLLKSRSGR